MVSTAAFHARVRGSVPGLGGSKETNMFLPHPCVKVSIVGKTKKTIKQLQTGNNLLRRCCADVLCLLGWHLLYIMCTDHILHILYRLYIYIYILLVFCI